MSTKCVKDTPHQSSSDNGTKVRPHRRRKPVRCNHKNKPVCCIEPDNHCKRKHRPKHRGKRPTKVEIYGTDGHELLPAVTDHEGRLVVVSSCTRFAEEQYLNVPVTSEITPLPNQDTSLNTVTSYAIINRGDHAAVVRLEISPNAVDYASIQTEIVPPQSMRVIVPSHYLRWTRLLVFTETEGITTHLDVYSQSQTYAL